MYYWQIMRERISSSLRPALSLMSFKWLGEYLSRLSPDITSSDEYMSEALRILEEARLVVSIPQKLFS
jgi:hypothetical protein